MTAGKGALAHPDDTSDKQSQDVDDNYETNDSQGGHQHDLLPGRVGRQELQTNATVVTEQLTTATKDNIATNINSTYDNHSEDNINIIHNYNNSESKKKKALEAKDQTVLETALTEVNCMLEAFEQKFNNCLIRPLILECVKRGQ